MEILEESFMSTIGIVVVITLMGLISVVLGLKVGIKRLSQINIILCAILLSIIFFGWSNKLHIRWIGSKLRLIPSKIS